MFTKHFPQSRVREHRSDKVSAKRKKVRFQSENFNTQNDSLPRRGRNFTPSTEWNPSLAASYAASGIFLQFLRWYTAKHSPGRPLPVARGPRERRTLAKDKDWRIEFSREMAKKKKKKNRGGQTGLEKILLSSAAPIFSRRALNFRCEVWHARAAKRAFCHSPLATARASENPRPLTPVKSCRRQRSGLTSNWHR